MSVESIQPRRVKPHSSLKAWRTARGLNQRDAAKELGMSQTSYRRLEAHVTTTRRDKLAAVMAKTGVALDELMGLAE